MLLEEIKLLDIVLNDISSQEVVSNSFTCCRSAAEIQLVEFIVPTGYTWTYASSKYRTDLHHLIGDSGGQSQRMRLRATFGLVEPFGDYIPGASIDWGLMTENQIEEVSMEHREIDEN
jgi:hypothetical protein